MPVSKELYVEKSSATKREDSWHCRRSPATFDMVQGVVNEKCRNFTKSKWSILAGNTNNYKNLIHHLDKRKIQKGMTNYVFC